MGVGPCVRSPIPGSRFPTFGLGEGGRDARRPVPFGNSVYFVLAGCTRVSAQPGALGLSALPGLTQPTECLVCTRGSAPTIFGQSVKISRGKQSLRNCFNQKYRKHHNQVHERMHAALRADSPRRVPLGFPERVGPLLRKQLDLRGG